MLVLMWQVQVMTWRGRKVLAVASAMQQLAIATSQCPLGHDPTMKHQMTVQRATITLPMKNPPYQIALHEPSS